MMMPSKNMIIKIVLVSSFCVSLLAALLHVNTETATGSEHNRVNGTVVMGTKGESLPDTITLKLFEIDQTANTITEIESTTPDYLGNFKFRSSLSNLKNYRIVVIGSSYIDYFDLKSENHTSVEIKIYSKTTSLENISVKDYLIMIPSLNAKNRIAGFLSVVEIENSSDRVWIPDITNPSLTGLDLFRFNLPKRYKSLSVESQLPEGNILEIETGFAMTNPIPPGSHSILISYQAEYKEDNLKFPLRLPFGANEIKILIPKDKGIIKNKYFQQTENVFINQDTFLSFEGSKIEKGTQLDVEFKELPEPNAQENLINLIQSRTYSVILVGFLSIIILMVISYFFWKHLIDTQGQENFTSRQKLLIHQIALLDRNYEMNEIPAEKYHEERTILMEKIVSSDSFE